MDFLVLSPPACPPSEPPSGAFVLASALAGNGLDAGFMDLSLAFFHHQLRQNRPTQHVLRSLEYLEKSPQYTPLEHRSAAGALHHQLKYFSRSFPGWALSAMDLLPPKPVHHPFELIEVLRQCDPFAAFWEQSLPEILSRHQPKKVLLSIAYLSQLPASISLAGFLQKQGIRCIAGGSLLRSLYSTGEGLNLLGRIFPDIDVSNGSNLLEGMDERSFLEKLSYPNMLCPLPYLSGRPILPLTLSTGCYWSGCLFCPDNDMKYIQIRTNAISAFLSSIPQQVKDQRPVIHLLDSAMPKNRLKAFMPLSRQLGFQFYGFARPEKRMAEEHFLREMAESGCLMLQLGVEGGNDALLSRFNKGIHPDDAKRMLSYAAGVGIRTYVYLLFGLPGETDMEREDTRRLVRENIDSIDFLNLSIFNLPRHCELSSRTEEFGIEADSYANSKDAIELYRPFIEKGSLTSPRTSPRAAARSWLTNTFLPDETIRAAVRRTPKWFRAAHLALMNLEGRRGD